MRTLDDDWSGISYTAKRIYFPQTGTSISDEYVTSIKLTEAISDTDTLFYVGCVSTKVEFELNNFTTPIEGAEIEVYIQKADTDEIRVFKGKVNTAEMNGANKTVKAVAYDAMFEIFNSDVTQWYLNLTFPMTMLAFRNAFFTHFGITQKTATLLNDSYMVYQTIGGDGILGRDLLKPLCEANAVFGHINYDGEMEYISFTNSTKTIPVGEVSAMTKEDYNTDLIDKVIVREDEQDIGAVAGYGSNAYIVEGNMFFLGLSAQELGDIADDFLNALDSYTYRPLTVDDQYNPAYELGDKVTVPDGFGGTYTSYILERTTDFIRESIKARGVKDYSKSASYSNESLIKLRGKTNRLFRSVEETRSMITDVEEGLQTEIRQTAEGLEIQIEDLQAQIDGEIAYYERETGAPTLLNYPYWDFTTSIPCNNTIRTADIYEENMAVGGNQFPHFTYTEQNRKEHRSDLCYVDDTNLAYRFVIEEGVWYWKEIADSDYTQILSRLATLEATAEALQIEYNQISLELGSDYYTKVETDSKITQSASQIQTTVSATYATKTTTNNLQTQITQQAGLISAKASQSAGTSSSFAYELTPTKFELKANNNTVFKCDQNGISTLNASAITMSLGGLNLGGHQILMDVGGCIISNTPRIKYSSAAGGYVFEDYPLLRSSGTGGVLYAQ